MFEQFFFLQDAKKEQETLIIGLNQDVIVLENTISRLYNQQIIALDYKEFLNSLNKHVRRMLTTFDPDFKKISHRLNFIRSLLPRDGKVLSLADQLMSLKEKDIQQFQGIATNTFYNLLVQRRTILEAQIYLKESNFDTTLQGIAKMEFVQGLLDYLQLRREEGTHVTAKIVNFFTPLDLSMREHDIYAFLDAIIANDIDRQREALAEEKIKNYKGLFSARLYGLMDQYRAEFRKEILTPRQHIELIAVG